MPHGSAARAANGQNLETREDRVALRSEPRRDAPIVIYLERGRRLKELRRSGAWVKGLVYGTLGTDGWVRISEVTPVRAAADRAPAPGIGEERAATAPSRVEPPFRLVVRGARQPFRARCLIVNSHGAKRRIAMTGVTPETHALNGGAVDCRVDRVDQHAGTLQVELYGGRSQLPLGTNATDDAFGCVHVRSDGPWGRAYGRRCSRAVRF